MGNHKWALNPSPDEPEQDDEMSIHNWASKPSPDKLEQDDEMSNGAEGRGRNGKCIGKAAAGHKLPPAWAEVRAA